MRAGSPSSVTNRRYCSRTLTKEPWIFSGLLCLALGPLSIDSNGGACHAVNQFVDDAGTLKPHQERIRLWSAQGVDFSF
jgi:hypothetical protein